LRNNSRKKSKNTRASLVCLYAEAAPPIPSRNARESVSPTPSAHGRGCGETGSGFDDVQGQELNVLQGTAGFLKRHAVRDIVFEDN
jgi:hypothetical protein